MGNYHMKNLFSWIEWNEILKKKILNLFFSRMCVYHFCQGGVFFCRAVNLKISNISDLWRIFYHSIIISFNSRKKIFHTQRRPCAFRRCHKSSQKEAKKYYHEAHIPYTPAVFFLLKMQVSRNDNSPVESEETQKF